MQPCWKASARLTLRPVGSAFKPRLHCLVPVDPGLCLSPVTFPRPASAPDLLTHLPCLTLVLCNFCGLALRPGLSFEPDHHPEGSALPAQVL